MVGRWSCVETWRIYDIRLKIKGAARLLFGINAVRRFDTENAEARAKPNRPDGRLMSVQVTAGSSILLRQSYGG